MMPIRKEKSAELPRRAPITKAGKLSYLAQLGAYYLKLKRDEKSLKSVITKKNAEIKEAVEENRNLFILNGKHLELYAPMGDGMNEIFIQIQNKESVGLVDNIIALMRNKLGDKAENYIMTKEVLHSNAMESMLNQGLITEKELLEWTTVSKTQSLIVKANKQKK